MVNEWKQFDQALAWGVPGLCMPPPPEPAKIAARSRELNLTQVANSIGDNRNYS